MEKTGNFTDLYQLTMMYGYWQQDRHQERAVFDLYFRKNPFGHGFTIAAGLAHAVEYLLNLQFTKTDLEYLGSTGLFPDPGFLQQLATWRWRGTVRAVSEGTPVFPREPILQVSGTLWETQLVETALLNIIGFQSLVATKARRIVDAANGKPVMEFGSRRAQEGDAAVWGARAAVIGGCTATSNVTAGQQFGIPIAGTHAHSWVMSFSDELTAFRAYAQAYPNNLILLVDTYDTLKSGVPNAIKVFDEQKHKPSYYGIRLDSGDLAYLSREARIMLDAAGYPDAKIIASNDLDEHLIRELEIQGAKIDAYGVGTKLITGYDQPALGCVYKLAALWDNKSYQWVPKLKRSENPEKITVPGVKQVVRCYLPNGEASVDLLLLSRETLPFGELTVFDPIHTWKRKTITNFTTRILLQKVLEDGKQLIELPSLSESVAYAKQQLITLSAEHRRLLNPHGYHVDLSQELWDLQQGMLGGKEQ